MKWLDKENDYEQTPISKSCCRRRSGDGPAGLCDGTF
jgi:hypothetical protein